MSRVPQIELQQCTGLEKGKPPAQQPYYGDGAALYLTPEYLRGAAIACESVKPSTNAVRVDSGDTILLWDGSNAGEVMRGRPGILASTMSRVNHDDRFLPPYFFYALKRWEAHLKGQTSGSGIPHVDKEILGRLTITEFERPEQSMIAEVLATVDGAIEQTEALIAKQQRIKTGLMQDLLTRGIDEHGSLRSEATHKFKDSPLGRIPVGWDVVTLLSFASRHKHAFVDGPFGSNLKTVHYRECGIPIIQSGFVTSGRFHADTYLYVDEHKFRAEIRSRVVPGDIVMAKIGARCGMCAILPDDHPIGIIAGNCIKITVSTQNSNEYVLSCLQYEYTKTHFEDVISTTAQPAVNMPALKSMLVKRPPQNEQFSIAAHIQHAQNLIDKSECAADKLRRIKTGIMQDLLTGGRRVTALLVASPEEAAS